MLNWIVWNRTVYMYKNEFGINNLQWLMCHKTKPNWNQFMSRNFAMKNTKLRIYVGNMFC